MYPHVANFPQIQSLGKIQSFEKRYEIIERERGKGEDVFCCVCVSLCFVVFCCVLFVVFCCFLL